MANGSNLLSVYAILCDCVLLFGARSAYVLPMYIVRGEYGCVLGVRSRSSHYLFSYILNSQMRTSFTFALSLTRFAVLLLQTNAATLRSLDFVRVCWLKCRPYAQMRFRLSLICDYFGQTFAIKWFSIENEHEMT